MSYVSMIYTVCPVLLSKPCMICRYRSCSPRSPAETTLKGCHWR